MSAQIPREEEMGYKMVDLEYLSATINATSSASIKWNDADKCKMKEYYK